MIIEKAVKAGDLPEHLRAGADPEATVLVSVRPLTVNGFTEEFEAGVLQAEKDTEGEPFRPARDVLKELEAIIAEDEGPSRQRIFVIRRHSPPHCGGCHGRTSAFFTPSNYFRKTLLTLP